MPRNEKLDTVGLIVRDVQHVLNHKLFAVSDYVVIAATQDICNEGVFEKRSPAHDMAQGLLFTPEESARKRPLPMCGPITGKPREKRSLRSIKDGIEITSFLVDDLSVCVACCFSRHGYGHMYTIENLVRIREYVVAMLQEVGYKVSQEALYRSPSRNNWPTMNKWGCLARVSGLTEDQVLSLTRAAHGHVKLAV